MVSNIELFKFPILNKDRELLLFLSNLKSDILATILVTCQLYYLLAEMLKAKHLNLASSRIK